MYLQDYDLTFKTFGVVLHIPSGATICLNTDCRKAVHYERMFHHLTTKHSLKDHLRSRNIELTEQVFINTLLEKGATCISDMGMYMHPSKVLLPTVSALETVKGFMCNLCPLENVTTCAYYSQSVLTMTKHIRRVHPAVHSSSYSSCYVQCLFKHQQDKVYFGVDFSEILTQSNGPQFTDETKRRLESILQRSKAGVAFTDPLECTKFMGGTEDHRIFSRFYKETNWYSFVPIFVQEDSIRNRIRLYQWVNLPVSHSSLAYLVKPIEAYFNNIQELLNQKNYF